MISVIIPCYNHGKFIDAAITSIKLDKHTTNFEVIIINDGSTDPFTIEKLNQLQRQGYKVIHQQNEGLAKARNHGIKVSTGKYILPLDCDNKIYPEVFIEAANIMEHNNIIDVVHTDALYSGTRSGIWYSTPFQLKKLLYKNYIDACALIRKSKLEEVAYYSEDMPIMGHEDWELWIKLSAIGCQFEQLAKIGFEYQTRDDSMARKISLQDANKTRQYIFSKHSHLASECYLEVYQNYIDPSDITGLAKKVSFLNVLKVIKQKAKKKLRL